MPQAEYEVWMPLSKTTISRCGSSLRTKEAQLIPAASPPMITSRDISALLVVLDL
jgi:hypothetical protein